MYLKPLKNANKQTPGMHNDFLRKTMLGREDNTYFTLRVIQFGIAAGNNTLRRR
jgi:hypothetical protein